MAVRKMCKECGVLWEVCLQQASHKPFIRYRVDVQPGGRSGKRIKASFVDHKEAVQWEREQLVNYSKGEYRVGRPNIAFKDLVEQYWEKHCKVWMNRPERSERYRLNNFIQYFGRETRNVTLDSGQDYLSYRKAKGVDIDTINREINSLKHLGKWATEHGYFKSNPFVGIKKISRGITVRATWLRDKDLQKLFTALSPSLLENVLFAINTGFRKENVENVMVQDVNLQEGWITARKTKSGKDYRVPIIPSYRNRLLALIGERTEGKLLPVANLDDNFREAVKAAGLYTHNKDPQRVTFHVLRHTYAAHLLKAGKSLYAVSKWLGHSSIRMTEAVYGHLCDEFQQEQVKDVTIGDVTSVVLPSSPDPKMIGPYGIRTRDLCLESVEPDDNPETKDKKHD